MPPIFFEVSSVLSLCDHAPAKNFVPVAIPPLCFTLALVDHSLDSWFASLVFVRGSCVHAYVRRDPLAPIVTPPLRPNTAMEITMELGRNREKIGEVHDKVRAVGKEG